MKNILLALLVLASAKAIANTSSENTTSASMTSTPIAGEPKGLIPFFGLATGYTPNTSFPAEGTPVSARILGSYYIPQVVFDLGLGLANQQLVRNEALNGAISGTALEAAARYRWVSRWQVGVVANDFLNQGGRLGASQGDAQFVGLQALKEFNIGEQWLARAGGRAMTETNNTGASVNTFLVEFQIGWNQSSRTASIENVAAATVIEQPETMTEPVVHTEAPVPTNILASFTLKERGNGVAKIATFNTSKYTLKNHDRAYMRKLGKVLAANKDLFSEIKIHGYADVSGKLANNKKLSLLRAETVRHEILASGHFSSKNVYAIGEGVASNEGKIQDTDRRVEIEFTKVKNQSALERLLSSF